MSQVIRRSAAILRALEQHPEGRSVAEVAALVSLPRSTVHRLLQSLAEEHLVTPVSEERGFRLGAGLMHLATSATKWLVENITPFLRDLSVELEETVDLAVLSGSNVYFIDQVAAPHRLQAVSQTGLAFPLHCTANGKALLADMTDDQVRALVGESLVRHTANTIANIDDLLAELHDVRTRRVAFDRDEHTDGISAAGTSIRNPYGLALAMSVPVPTSRFSENEERITSGVIDGRKRIENHFAFQP